MTWWDIADQRPFSPITTKETYKETKATCEDCSISRLKTNSRVFGESLRFVSVSVSVCVCVYVCVVCACVYTCVYVWMCACVYTCVYVCTFIGRGWSGAAGTKARVYIWSLLTHIRSLLTQGVDDRVRRLEGKIDDAASQLATVRGEIAYSNQVFYRMCSPQNVFSIEVKGVTLCRNIKTI